MSDSHPSPGDPGTPTPPPAPAYGAPAQGAPVPQKKSRKGLWLGLGGCCGLGLILLVILIIVSVASGGGDDDAAPASATTAAEAPAEDAPAEEAPAEDAAAEEAPAEAPAADSDIAITIGEVERTTEIGDEYLGAKAQGEFVVVHYTFANNSDEAVDLMSDELKLVSADGTEYSESTDGIMAFPDEYAAFETVNPGNSFTGVVVFDVPEGAEVTTLRYSPTFSFDGPVEVALP